MNYLNLNNKNDKTMTELVWAGAFAGLIAGILMSILLIAWSGIVGLGALLPVYLIGGFFYGVDSILGGTGPFISGLVIHLVVSASLGAFFAFLWSPRVQTLTSRYDNKVIEKKQVVQPIRSWGQLVFSGLIYGIGIWLLMTFVMLPLFDSTLQERVAMAPAVWFFAHALFGIALGSAPFLQRTTAKAEIIEEQVIVAGARPRAA